MEPTGGALLRQIAGAGCCYAVLSEPSTHGWLISARRAHGALGEANRVPIDDRKLQRLGATTGLRTSAVAAADEAMALKMPDLPETGSRALPLGVLVG